MPIKYIPYGQIDMTCVIKGTDMSLSTLKST